MNLSGCILEYSVGNEKLFLSYYKSLQNKTEELFYDYKYKM